MNDLNNTIDTPHWNCVLVGEVTLLIRCAELLLDRRCGIRAIVAVNPAIADWAQAYDIPLVAPGKGLAGRLQDFDYLFSSDRSVIGKKQQRDRPAPTESHVYAYRSPMS